MLMLGLPIPWLHRGQQQVTCETQRCAEAANQLGLQLHHEHFGEHGSGDEDDRNWYSIRYYGVCIWDGEYGLKPNLARLA